LLFFRYFPKPITLDNWCSTHYRNPARGETIESRKSRRQKAAIVR